MFTDVVPLLNSVSDKMFEEQLDLKTSWSYKIDYNGSKKLKFQCFQNTAEVMGNFTLAFNQNEDKATVMNKIYAELLDLWEEMYLLINQLPELEDTSSSESDGEEYDVVPIS